jgi:hypothetical protein
MIRIKEIKASEVNEIVDMLRREHGAYVASYNEMLKQEYYDYDDGLTVIIYPDTIENDL